MTILPKKKSSSSSKGPDHLHRDPAGGQGPEFPLSHATNAPVGPGSGNPNGWGPGVPSGSSAGWSPPPPGSWPAAAVAVNPGSSEFVVETGSKRPNSASFADEAGGPSASKRRHRERSSSVVQSVVGPVVVGSPSSEVAVSGPARVGASPVSAPGPVLPAASRQATCSPSAPQPGTSEEVVPESGGYNSEDEYSHLGVSLSEEEWLEKDRKFEKMMKKKGFIIKRMVEDGSCLFRAVADQIYGDQEMHPCVRRDCMDYIAQNADYYSHYVTEAIGDYIKRKRYLGVHGNHLEIQALSEMYNRPIHIYCYSPNPNNIFQSGYEHSNAPIRLSYHRGVHYNSLIDPYKATIGVGLGLPGFSPGSADRNLLSQAYRASEDSMVERTMLEDKIRATDWEATNEAIEEQVARESYLQWLRDNERRNKALERSSTVTSGELRAEALRPRSPKAHSPKPSCSNAPATNASNSPKAGCSFYTDDSRASNKVMGKDFQLMETASFLNGLPPEMFGLDDWSETDVLTQVIAASQQEYLDSIKKKHSCSEPANSANDSSTASSMSSSSSNFIAIDTFTSAETPTSSAGFSSASSSGSATGLNNFEENFQSTDSQR